jgi:hypothetical protein
MRRPSRSLTSARSCATFEEEGFDMRASTTFLTLGLAVGIAGAARAQTIGATQNVRAEVVAADAAGRTITVRQPVTTGTPAPQIVTLNVASRAAAGLAGIQIGDQVTLTCVNGGAAATASGGASTATAEAAANVGAGATGTANAGGTTAGGSLGGRTATGSIGSTSAAGTAGSRSAVGTIGARATAAPTTTPVATVTPSATASPAAMTTPVATATATATTLPPGAGTATGAGAVGSLRGRSATGSLGSTPSRGTASAVTNADTGAAPVRGGADIAAQWSTLQESCTSVTTISKVRATTTSAPQ